MTDQKNNKKTKASLGKHASSSSSSLLIKGYLPVRLKVPKPSQAILFPSTTTNDTDNNHDPTITMDTTYFYVREHQGKTSPLETTAKALNNTEISSGTSTAAAAADGCTLFVANAPFVPGISTKILLRSLLGRYGDVSRVTVVSNPRGRGDGKIHGNGTPSDNESTSLLDNQRTTSMGCGFGDGVLNGYVPSSLYLSSSLGRWTSTLEDPSYLQKNVTDMSEGKFAHVVFTSPKELKKAKSALEDLMNGMGGSLNKHMNKKKNKKKKKRRHYNQNDDEDDNNDDHHDTTSSPPALTLDSIEIQTLSDESWKQWEDARNQKMKRHDDSHGHDDYDDGDDEKDSDVKHHQPLDSGITAIAQRYRDSCGVLAREHIMDECNAVMQAYEDAEERKRIEQATAKSQPDDDGFITVSYANNNDAIIGSKSELEQSVTATTPSRRKGNKRTRKKKDAFGSSQLEDFYKFQKKESRKRTMDELRKQFQLDLQKVKRLKEEKQYRPF